MANGTAAQRKVYGGPAAVASIWQREETDAADTVAANGYYAQRDIETARVGDKIEAVVSDGLLILEITAIVNGAFNTVVRARTGTASVTVSTFDFTTLITP